ncbi:MAG: hypothetical protein QHH24_00215 [Candidatus Bathyarchaeota archaeon]|nr:hypothetical protein [Candidatus Bathyarchaeota archaeon]
MTCYDYYQVRVWNMTFGAEGVFGAPHDCVASWWDHIEYSPAAPAHTWIR